ncbi:DUF4349 domain-containing protein [Kitasatospora sp. NPDC054939]
MPGGRRRAGVAAAGMVVAVLLAGGCGASGDRGGSGTAMKADAAAAPDLGKAAPGQGQAQNQAEAAAKPPAPNAAGSPAPAAASRAPGTAPAADSRLIAYSAQLTIRSQDVPKVLSEARALATAAGGYVGNESTNGVPADSTAGPMNGQITLKVPSAAYQQTLDRLAALDTVVSRRSQADDVTLQVADVESRLQTQRASVERIRALMSQAKSLQEVTTLESELARREADLESLQRQQKELAAKTSLSTITVDVRRDAKPVPDTPDAEKKDTFWGSVGDALSGGWRVLLAIVRGVAMAAAASAPFLVVLVPVVLVLRFLRRRRRAVQLPPVPAHLPAQPAAPPHPAGPAPDARDEDARAAGAPDEEAPAEPAGPDGR